MDALARYARQTILAEVGQAGQHKIACSAAAVVGCGALGTHIANHLVRAGVGRVRIIDRDFVELSNLQRQVLYDEEDAERGLPKAVAAAAGLRRINSTVQVEEVVADVNPDNAEKLLRDVQVVLDGTDNFETRFLINDVCLKLNVPWIYGGAIATYGMVMPIVPHVTPCFRCFVADMPPPGSAPTCDTVGVLGTVPAVIAAMQATEALKLLSGNEAKLNKDLVFVDLWAGQAQHLDLAKSDSPCPACDLGQYDFLAAREGQGTWRSVATSLCGRNAVQVTVRGGHLVDFPSLAERLRAAGEVAFNEHILRLRVDGHELTVFPDGRSIIKGCTDPAIARALYARYIGT